MALMDYPGWDYGEDTFPSQSKCVDYEQGYDKLKEIDYNTAFVRVKKRSSYSDENVLLSSVNAFYRIRVGDVIKGFMYFTFKETDFETIIEPLFR